MNLNPIEWSKAQGLLLQLVQMLSPLTQQEATAISPLKLRFFVPPSREETGVYPLRHPVTVLKATLHAAREQMQEWIEQLPTAPNGKVEEKTPPSRTSPSAKGEGSPVPKPEPKPPLSLQAKVVIDQVRDAIGSLCTSTNITDPKAAPLREALIRIKPLIDEMIKAVSHEGMHSAGEDSSRQFLAPIPRLRRDNHIAKQLPTPRSEIKQREETPRPVHTVSRIASEPRRTESVISEPRPKPTPTGSPAVVQQDAQAEARPINRITPPGAPFSPETRSLTPARKKKKRKGFWFREDKDDSPS
ncbi:MAG TPA: hypothetical protein VLF94_02640 [Chlamydiales bacterium]|nr:hypothetical protein [Chlamydiales bacterium]